MRRTVLRLSGIACLAALCVSALAWGVDGHKIIARVAYKGLSDKAKAKFDSLMQPITVDEISVWPDVMRNWQRGQNPPAWMMNDPEAGVFEKDDANKNQAMWHFVDMPLGLTDYASWVGASNEDDAIHAIRRCILVLQGKPDPKGKLTAPQALRLIVHLVGDLHQPLHSATGMWEKGQAAFKLVTKGGVTDVGATGLGLNYVAGFNPEPHYPYTPNLHHYWDDILVDNTATFGKDSLADHEARIAKLVTKDLNPAGSAFALTGNPEDWPAVWEKESAQEAKKIYASLPAVNKPMIAHNKDGDVFKANINLDAKAYNLKFKVASDNCLAKAAFRLGAVLNSVLGS